MRPEEPKVLRATIPAVGGRSTPGTPARGARRSVRGGRAAITSMTATEHVLT